MKLNNQPRKILASRMRKESTTVDTIIIHSMSEYIVNEGDIIHAIDFLNDIDLGAHYFIAPDGLVTVGVHPEFRTSHVGRSEYKGRKWLNETSIGIEFLVDGVSTYQKFLNRISSPTYLYTSEQYIAGGELIAGLKEQFPKILDRIIGHDAVSGDGVRGEGRGKRDPGDYFDWGMLEGIIREHEFKMENTP